MLNLNTPNKQWNMYLNTLSSISGDDLTIKPDTRRNLLLEVSGNNNIFIKKGDVSYNLSNLITGDTSFSNVDVSVNLNPLNNNNSNLGLASKLWGNAYIRDISTTNISISGNMTISGTISNVIQIIPRLANDISLGSNTNTWQRAFIRDLSNISTINGTNWPLTGTAGPAGPRGPAGPTGPRGPTGPTGALGVSLNATLTDISNFRLTTKNRIYQEISGGINDLSWAAVNGYYGLAKGAYPSLNPLSSGVKAVSNWTVTTRFTWGMQSICWSPQLAIFVGIGSNNAARSTNGVNWTSISLSTQNSLFNNWWLRVCWSPELLLFVAVSYEGRVIRSLNGITWTLSATFSGFVLVDVCWSPELSMFAAITQAAITNGVITSRDGITWYQQTNIPAYVWTCICWSPELRIFAALTGNASMISSNGINWTYNSIPNVQAIRSICWSPELGIFVGVGGNPPGNSLISNNGINWTSYTMPWGVTCSPWNVAWSPQLKLFVVPNNSGGGKFIAHSTDGKNWTIITYSGEGKNYTNIAWSPELGIFACLSTGGGNGAIHTALTSSLKVSPPTSYNVFDSSFNIIDENGKWDFSNINVTTTLTVNNGPPITSDDRLKHNEVVINNGLDVIDQLSPKFYQKTQVLLDASYNGDLSGYAWTLEAGLIAQELLQISDLSFTVGGGDYYEQTYNLIKQTNDLSNSYYDLSNSYYDLSNSYYDSSNANYDLSNSYYDSSNANYEISYNLIAQHYNVNYNSVFVYGLAAIKELHAKVKAKETSILNRQAIINSLITRIEALESNNNV